ncbi:MAG: diaminopimelate epimerase [Labilithrix sp.]|nr:diaminopimelate epimerase [Labilithrix sp.]
MVTSFTAMVGDASSAKAGELTPLCGGDLDFHKYEGLGNDFVVVEADRADAVSVARARELCDRRLGVGADGVLLVLPPVTTGAHGRMVVINADGSVPEMCGNGLRCVALHVARRRDLREGTLVFDTDAGAKPCAIDDGDARGLVTVDMGPVRWTEDVTLDLDGDAWELALGDAGNPHAITRRAASRAEIERVGPRVEKHPRFPAGTNVEFAIVRSPTEIDLVVWERGVGITQACGTGACATVAVAVAKGWSPAATEVAVKLPGGVLHVRMDERGHAIMRGPARHVFSGSAPAAEAARSGVR